MQSSRLRPASSELRAESTGESREETPEGADMRSGSAALSSADPPDDSSGSECESGVESGRARAADDSSGCESGRARAADVVGNGSRAANSHTAGTAHMNDLLSGGTSSTECEERYASICSLFDGHGSGAGGASLRVDSDREELVDQLLRRAVSYLHCLHAAAARTAMGDSKYQLSCAQIEALAAVLPRAPHKGEGGMGAGPDLPPESWLPTPLSWDEVAGGVVWRQPGRRPTHYSTVTVADAVSAGLKSNLFSEEVSQALAPAFLTSPGTTSPDTSAPAAAADAALWAELERLKVTLSGLGYDDTGGHAAYPHRSMLRRASFRLGHKRHATKAQAALRILEAIRDHGPYTAAGSFPLSQHHAVDREVLDNLVALAREAAEAEASGAPTAAAPADATPDAAPDAAPTAAPAAAPAAAPDAAAPAAAAPAAAPAAAAPKRRRTVAPDAAASRRRRTAAASATAVAPAAAPGAAAPDAAAPAAAPDAAAPDAAAPAAATAAAAPAAAPAEEAAAGDAAAPMQWGDAAGATAGAGAGAPAGAAAGAAAGAVAGAAAGAAASGAASGSAAPLQQWDGDVNMLDDLAALTALGAAACASSKDAAPPEKPPRTAASAPPVDFDVEQVSGIRIQPAAHGLSRQDVCTLASTFEVHKMRDVPQLMRSPSAATQPPWLTIGVLVNKGPTQFTRSDSRYCVCKFSDLQAAGATTIAVFLFGEACSTSWKVLPGAVFALLSAKPVPPKDGAAHGHTALSIEKEQQLRRIGQVRAADSLLVSPMHSRSMTHHISHCMV
jgi:hypothetical protein